jgi:5-methylcytosine-specific restriction endonuclease McrA
MDHRVPRSKGGGWELGNLLPAHHGCNSARGNTDLDDEPDIHSQEW